MFNQTKIPLMAKCQILNQKTDVLLNQQEEVCIYMTKAIKANQRT